MISQSFSSLRVTAFLMFLAAAMAGCTCAVGQRIVIQSSDGTDPSIVMDFHLPNGQIETIGQQSSRSVVVARGASSQITVIASAKDGEGVQDVQIWASPYS